MLSQYGTANHTHNGPKNLFKLLVSLYQFHLYQLHGKQCRIRVWFWDMKSKSKTNHKQWRSKIQLPENMTVCTRFAEAVIYSRRNPFLLLRETNMVGISWWFSNNFAMKTYEGWSKSLFLFLIQRKVWIISKLCDVHIEIRYISSDWMLLEKQLWRRSLWLVTSRDIPKGVIIVNRLTRVASAKFDIFFRSKKH